VKFRWQVAATVAALALAAACGADVAGDGGGPTPTEPTEPTTEPTEPTTEPTAEPTEEPTDMDDEGPQQEITGTLGGDAELEGGCAWLETAGGARYEVIWPEGYRIDFATLQLIGPDGETLARQGEEVTVVGRTSDDFASICMVGTIFEASEVRTG
jgi:hypothetical protein